MLLKEEKANAALRSPGLCVHKGMGEYDGKRQADQLSHTRICEAEEELFKNSNKSSIIRAVFIWIFTAYFANRKTGREHCRFFVRILKLRYYLLSSCRIRTDEGPVMICRL